VNVPVPVNVGVPLITPPDVSVSPAGNNVPPVKDHVYGAVPPLAASVAEYAWFCIPFGKLVVVTTSVVGCTVRTVLPLTVPCVALIVELPPATADASPALLIVATAVFDDDQLT
jgi:hypothetical protein